MNIVEMRYYLDWEEKKNDSTLKKYPKIARKQNGNQKKHRGKCNPNLSTIKFSFSVGRSMVLRSRFKSDFDENRNRRNKNNQKNDHMINTREQPNIAKVYVRVFYQPHKTCFT